MTPLQPTAPLRVLFLATYFPKPGNELMGPWALKQAQALLRQGLDVRVVSFTSWVPKILARSAGSRAYAACPRTYSWGPLSVEYPRWLVYQVGFLKRWAYRDPRRQIGIGWWSAKPVLSRIVREFKPDVVFAHHTAVNGMLAERLEARYKLPFVVTDHDFAEIEDCRIHPGRREVFKRVSSAAFRMIAVSSRMESLLKVQFPAARTMTLPNGTDPLAPELWKTPRPPEMQGKRVVFSLAAFYTRKGIPLLIRAFAAAITKHTNVVLRIAGDGPERPLAEAALREAGMGDRIRLLGALPHGQAMQEMVWSDVFALVGWDEPFATVFLEAASAGKPMVWCNDGGINDVLRDGEHGIAVPPKDPGAAGAAIERLILDASLRARVGAAARRLFETKLTWDANAQAMGTIFREAVAACRTT